MNDRHDQVPQGDRRLLETELGVELLAAPVPANIAYLAHDGTPRVIPMNFHWNGREVVMGAFAGTFKVEALSTRPRVAISIGLDDSGAKVLLLRGDVELTDYSGLLPEYAAAHRKTVGGAGSEGFLRAIDVPGLAMVRIALNPAWVGILDFAERSPLRTPDVVRNALGG